MKRRVDAIIALLAGTAFFAFGVGIAMSIPALFLVGGLCVASAAVLWVLRPDG